MEARQSQDVSNGMGDDLYTRSTACSSVFKCSMQCVEIGAHAKYAYYANMHEYITYLHGPAAVSIGGSMPLQACNKFDFSGLATSSGMSALLPTKCITPEAQLFP